ncbi:MAG: hypothetical protein K2J82_09390 [Muribaculaceae bacterium]|nr:hypothetical protein [Muribaculaceae bacterium]
MKKDEALETAVLFRTLYETLKGCAEGKDERYEDFKYIPFNIPFAPSVEQIKGLASYILENEDRRLYESTFGMIDIDFLNSIYWKLDEAQWGWDGEVKYNLSIGNKSEVRRLIEKNDEFLFIVEVYDLWGEIGAILREARLLQPIFTNIIPQPATSTPVITEMVIDTSTGLTPEWWEKYPELDTPEARLYVSRAIERGFIKITSTGLRWITIGGGRGGKAQLGYFLCKVYPPHRPTNYLEKVFDVKKLSTDITNGDLLRKKEPDEIRADVMRYKTEIDKIFID